jgi:hypothetical protein
MASLAGDLAQALDPVIFAREALGFSPDFWQEQVLRWSGKRLLLCCARQTGKSTVTAILALHRAIFYPASLVLLVSPSLRQSSELFRKVLSFYRQLDQPIPPEAESSLRLELKTGSRIISLPGKESTIRGFSGAALIIEDEAARVPDDLYYTIRPMLAVSGGRLILMSTPFGKRGHFFKEWTEGGDTWERVMVKATDCPRISPEFLEEERQALGEWWFRQEYLCEFVETADQVFTYDQVMTAVTEEVKPLFGGADNV